MGRACAHFIPSGLLLAALLSSCTRTVDSATTNAASSLRVEAVAEPTFSATLMDALQLAHRAASLQPASSQSTSSTAASATRSESRRRCPELADRDETFLTSAPERDDASSYQAALQGLRQQAREAGQKRQKSLVIERNRASVEVYSQAKEDGLVDISLNVVAAGYEVWSIQGFEETDAEAVILPNGKAGPSVVQLNVSACEGGVCGAGCFAGTFGATILFQWYHAELTVLPFGDAALEPLADVDGDGLLEMNTGELSASLDSCDARWCCGAKQSLSVATYLGWENGCWRYDLARFRPLYELRLKQAQQQLSARVKDHETDLVRCEMAKTATSVLWLAQMLGEEPEPLRRQWEAETSGFSPADCYPVTSDEPELRELAATWADVRASVLRSEVPRAVPHGAAVLVPVPVPR
jgi:hypothetical protein